MKKQIAKTISVMLAVIMVFTQAACGRTAEDAWLENACLDKDETTEELYEKALRENILVVYTVSTRATKTKEAFEETYPGLCVEIRDLRSPDLVEEVEKNYYSGHSDCDVIICNDNSGEFKSRIADTGIAVPYLPSDIAARLKDPESNTMGSFTYEAEMLFYDSAKYDECPITNIWELADEKYRDRIYMPNPLHSFSTYAFCGGMLGVEDRLASAYKNLYGSEPDTGGMSVSDYFWKSVSENVVFTNSSDEVLEALGSGSADFGFMVSSKLRLIGLGYDIAPIYRLDPFSGCRTSYSAMIARNSENINSAKLFIRFLYGESDGKGEGYKPFSTAGTWSVRTDIPDGNDVPLDEIDLFVPDLDVLTENREHLENYWMCVLESKA
ncbi:MAG: substrate-binding domain-containing protein [Lachnospiraceae bacterium]|nr:substrate-binding domain-containing protein [Lachnospiraceae bacterium]